MTWRLEQGDAVERLRELPAESVQACVTSPPYWGLRDYGTAAWEGGDSECDHAGPPKASERSGLKNDGRPEPGRKDYEMAATVPFRDVCGKCGAKRIDSQLGLEPTPEEYVANLVAVFREVRRVLRDDGSVWLNLGDSYFGAGRGPSDLADDRGFHTAVTRDGFPLKGVYRHGSLKSKDLVGIPWRVAFALQADGWWLRSDIIWNKPNPMPESVTDRPTRAHEYIFLLTKSARYFYDADAIREEGEGRLDRSPGSNGRIGVQGWKAEPLEEANGRNKRSVWTVTTQPYPEAHFATFPPKLIEPCILAGSPPKCCGECGAPWEREVEVGPEKEGIERGKNESAHRAHRWHPQRAAGGGLGTRERETLYWCPTCTCHYQEDSLATFKPDDSGRSVVLDPFAGSGTTGLVALRHDRSFIGIELNPDYCELARNRIRDDAPLFNGPLEAEQDEAVAYQSQMLIPDKQAGHGRRHAGFNERWKNR